MACALQHPLMMKLSVSMTYSFLIECHVSHVYVVLIEKQLFLENAEIHCVSLDFKSFTRLIGLLAEYYPRRK